MPKVLPEYLEQRRKQILDAAAECFCENGFHQTSMNDICEAAGLSPGAVYRYFRSKEDIITAINDESHERDAALIESITGQGSAFEVMSELGRAFLKELEESDVRLHMDLLAEMPRSEHIKNSIRDGAERIIDSFADFVRKGQAAGEIRAEIDAESLARVMCSLHHGFMVQQQIGCGVDAQRYVQTVIDLFTSGVFERAHAERAPLLSH